MATRGGLGEEVFVESACQAAPAMRRRYNDAVDINETRKARLEPEKVRAAIVRRLVERDEESCGWGNRCRSESLLDKRKPIRGVEERRLLRVEIVQRAQGFGFGGVRLPERADEGRHASLCPIAIPF